MTNQNPQDWIDEGLKLCHAIGKAPFETNWQNRPIKRWNKCSNVGLIHHLNQTCAIDLDDLERCKAAFDAIGIDIVSIISQGVQVVGNPENRKKAIFIVPNGQTLPTVSLQWSGHKHLFELRSGQGSQDIIWGKHPDGYQYQIIGDITDPPMLPDQLLVLWQNWQATKQILLAADPDWEPPKPINRKPAVFDGESVIARFNQEFSPFQLLLDNGYTQHGDRLLNPWSISKIPSVKMFDNGRQFYSWSFSCPFGDGKPHDAFDVYTYFSHNGDIKQAVKSAAELLGMSRSVQNRPMVESIDYYAESFVADERTPPSHRPPVQLVRDLMDFFNTSNGNTPAYALTHAALAFCSAIFARRFAFNSRSPIALYLGNHADSLAQLSSLVGVVQGAVADCGERKIIRSDGFSSAAFLKKALSVSPRLFWVTAEYANILAFSAKQNNSRGYDSSASLVRSIYNVSRIFVDADTWGQQTEGIEIWNPSLTLCAFMASGEIHKITKRIEYDRGTLQQILIADGGPLASPVNQQDWLALPEHLISVFKSAKPLGDIAKLESSTLCPDFIKIESNVDLEKQMEVFKDISEKFSEWHGIALGWGKIYKRICGVLAVADDICQPVVTPAISEWALNWTVYHLERYLERISIIGSDNGDPDVAQRVREVVYKFGKSGATPRDISNNCRTFRKLTPSQKEELLNSLVLENELIPEKSLKSIRYYEPYIGKLIQAKVNLQV